MQLPCFVLGGVWWGSWLRVVRMLPCHGPCAYKQQDQSSSPFRGSSTAALCPAVASVSHSKKWEGIYINQQHIYSESTDDPKSFPRQWWMLHRYWCEQEMNCCSQARQCSRGWLGISNLHRSCFPEVHFHILYFELGRQPPENGWIAVTMTDLYSVLPSLLSTLERMM